MITFGCEVRFSGSPISGFCPPATTTNGTFTGELRRNPATFALEIWDGDEWLSAVSNGYTQFIGSVIGSSDINIGALGLRKAIRLSRGTGVLINTISQPTSAQATVHVDTGVVACRPFNVVYVSVNYNDVNVQLNNGSTLIGHYIDIETAMLKYATMSNENYLVYVNAGTYDIRTDIQVQSHIWLQLAPGAKLTNGGGSIQIEADGKLFGEGDIECPIHVQSNQSTRTTVCGNILKEVTVDGMAKIRANTLEDLTVSLNRTGIFNVDVDCIHIGTVRTTTQRIGSVTRKNPYSLASQIIAGSAQQPNVYCQCTWNGTEYVCPFLESCYMGYEGTPQSTGDVAIYAESKLTIRANRRFGNSKFLFSIGRIFVSYHDWDYMTDYLVNGSTNYAPDAYITGLSSNATVDTRLEINSATDRTFFIGYQIGDGATLILDNVRHEARNNSIEANIYRSGVGINTSRVSLKDTILVGGNIGYNILGGAGRMTYLASFSSFGNKTVPSYLCTDVLGTNLQRISTDYWI